MGRCRGRQMSLAGLPSQLWLCTLVKEPFLPPDGGMREANYQPEPSVGRFLMNPLPAPAPKASSGLVPASLWTQKISINNDMSNSTFPFLVRRFAQTASEPCSASDSVSTLCTPSLSSAHFKARPAPSLLTGLCKSSSVPSKISLETPEVPRVWR